MDWPQSGGGLGITIPVQEKKKSTFTPLSPLELEAMVGVQRAKRRHRAERRRLAREEKKLPQPRGMLMGKQDVVGVGSQMALRRVVCVAGGHGVTNVVRDVVGLCNGTLAIPAVEQWCGALWFLV